MHLRQLALGATTLSLLAACGGGGGDAGTTAPIGTTGSCFNTASQTAGATLDTVTRASYTTPGTASYASHTVVGGTTTFNGGTARQTTETVLFSPDATLAATGQTASTTTATHFYSTDSGATSVKELGDTVVSGAPGSAVTTTINVVNTPYIESRFMLATGASFTQSYTNVQSGTIGGVVRSTTYAYVKTTQYNGIVSVTVPAGTYQACQFVETGTVSVNGSVPTSTGMSTLYVGVTNGVLLRTVLVTGTAPATSTTTVDLLSAAINGVGI